MWRIALTQTSPQVLNEAVFHLAYTTVAASMPPWGYMTRRWPVCYCASTRVISLRWGTQQTWG